MSRLINPMVLSIVFTVEAGFFGSAALAQQYMGYDDTLSGSYNYTISGRPGFAVEQLGSVTDATPLLCVMPHVIDRAAPMNDTKSTWVAR